MANGANRIFNIMLKTNVDTVSEVITLVVTEKDGNKLVLSNGDKLILTKDFLVFDSYIDLSKITVGDVFKAISLNGNQLYYVFDIVSSTNELDKYIQRIKRLEDRLD